MFGRARLAAVLAAQAVRCEGGCWDCNGMWTCFHGRSATQPNCWSCIDRIVGVVSSVLGTVRLAAAAAVVSQAIMVRSYQVWYVLHAGGLSSKEASSKGSSTFSPHSHSCVKLMAMVRRLFKKRADKSYAQLPQRSESFMVPIIMKSFQPPQVSFGP